MPFHSPNQKRCAHIGRSYIDIYVVPVIFASINFVDFKEVERRSKLDVICISICSNQNDSSASARIFMLCIPIQVHIVYLHILFVQTFPLKSLIFDCVAVPTEYRMCITYKYIRCHTVQNRSIFIDCILGKLNHQHTAPHHTTVDHRKVALAFGFDKH